MNATLPHVNALQRIFEHPRHGVVGMVDDLLSTCQEHGLRLDWSPERSRVRSIDGDWLELADAQSRTSVFRAILARIATLCNERKANSVSPYGGRGELAVGDDPPTIFEVAFTNSPTQQRLELAVAKSPKLRS